MYGDFASKLGSGAGKLGKKVAQSEAGRSAGKAAIKGASDAAAKDLTDRYFGGDEPTPTLTTAHIKSSSNNSKAIPPTSTSSSTPKPTVTIRAATDSDDEFEMMMQEQRRKAAMPRQKPSAFARFKPHVNLKGSETQKPQSRVVTRREKIYKYALTKEANWDRLPQALALYNFRGEMRCDLEFRKGQVIQIMTRTDTQDDWWEGKLEDRVGIFPANYVKLI